MAKHREQQIVLEIGTNEHHVRSLFKEEVKRLNEDGFVVVPRTMMVEIVFMPDGAALRAVCACLMEREAIEVRFSDDY